MKASKKIKTLVKIFNNNAKNTLSCLMKQFCFLDSRCMSTINRLKDELIKFLDKKTLFVEQLNKTENSNSLKMDFKYQE